MFNSYSTFETADAFILTLKVVLAETNLLLMRLYLIYHRHQAQQEDSTKCNRKIIAPSVEVILNRIVARLA